MKEANGAVVAQMGKGNGVKQMFFPSIQLEIDVLGVFYYYYTLYRMWLNKINYFSC